MDQQRLLVASLQQPTTGLMPLPQGGILGLLGSSNLESNLAALDLIRTEAVLEARRGVMLKAKLAAVRTHRRTEALLATALAPKESLLLGPVKSWSKEKMPSLFKEKSPQKPKKRRQTKKSWNPEHSFPSKLFDMLKRTEEDGQSHIISFLPHGKAFRVHKPDQFVREVLPRYFNTSRMASFQKQLGVYGFKRIKEGLDQGAIAREYFHRGATKEMIAKTIKRKKQRVPLSEPVSQQKERVVAWRGALRRTEDEN